MNENNTLKYVKRVMVDFDGVIRQTGGVDHGEPVPFVSDSIKKLQQMGYKVYVFSTRAAHGHEAFIYDWLELYGIEVDGITGFKLEADFYIDDKAIPFCGDWENTLNVLKMCETQKDGWEKVAVH